MRRQRSVWWAALGALVLVFWQGQVAHAATGPADAAGDHCVVALDATPVDDTTAAPESASAPTCFDTFAAAIDFATGGRVALDADATSVSEKQLMSAGAVSSEVSQVARPLLGVEYQNGSYGGSSLVLYGSSGTGCYSGDWYGFPSMADLGFNNRISSAKMYSNCLGKHHDGSSYTGSYTYCDANCPSLGSMNDRTSSIKFI
ncbi:hypothetical protein ABN028_07965 [Actinopolymorpha sp. B17G11]|uniref:hypothetical protein n=1 Tax=unclassified Actinopolymorpha TaxID=2627063 RepID=UPI0032D8F714